MGVHAGDAQSFTAVPGSLGLPLNAVFSPAKRRMFMRAFGSSQALMPMGGEAVWGDARSAPHDPAEGGVPEHGISRGSWLSTRTAAGNLTKYWTMDDAITPSRWMWMSG
jgi:hypothetical protein